MDSSSTAFMAVALYQQGRPVPPARQPAAMAGIDARLVAISLSP
ncbi:MAG TPA: hypothetical protein VGU61_18530 [Noviherbaspirillum sp.]|nr:hypothetical protein [Noviherbaspirillum sp.]HEV2612265.1 hypothetical protein [Noviherbaspirillum sp.]